jgi:hypothetical protein
MFVARTLEQMRAASVFGASNAEEFTKSSSQLPSYTSPCTINR